MLKVILLTIIILSVVALSVLIKLSKAFKVNLTRADKFVNLFFILTLFHASYIFLVRNFFNNQIYIKEAAPYGLIYSSFIYFGLSTLLDCKLKTRQLLMHLAPAIIATGFYLCLIIVPSFRISYGKSFIMVLYIATSISMIIYVSWGIWKMGNVNDSKYKEVVNLFSILSVLMIMVAFLYLIISYNRVFTPNEITNSNIPAIIVYLILLLGVIFTFQFRLNRIIKNLKKKNSEIKIEDKEDNEEEIHPYQKSTLSAETYHIYYSKLEEIMEVQKLYLNKDLSLSLLSKEMKVPRHHLTQLFSQYIGKNFHNYINGLRIQYACRLLADHNCNLTIENIAEESGFNSKVSFNRYFKTSMGCTPSEYRMIKND